MAAQDEQHMYSLPYDRVPMESNNYNDLINKPSINGHALVGDKTPEDLGINIPTKTSELTNDSGFATTSQIPTKTSDLTNDSHFTTKTYVDDEIDALENKINSLDGITVVKNLIMSNTFASTFDNLATALTTALTAIQTSLSTDEFVEIKSLNIETVGNLKPLNLITIDENTVIAGLNIDWQGVSYVNNVMQAIDIVNKKVLSLTMTNDLNDDAFVSYFNDSTSYNFTIYYTKYGVFNL
jgi:hypothetical protein